MVTIEACAAWNTGARCIGDGIAQLADWWALMLAICVSQAQVKLILLVPGHLRILSDLYRTKEGAAVGNKWATI